MLYDYAMVTVDSVRSETDAALEVAGARIERAVASVGSPTFDDTLLPLELAGAALVQAYGRGAFMGQVHTDTAVRDAGNEAEERINKWRVAVVFRSDLYDAVRAFAETDDAKALEGERARLLEHWLRDFRRAGHELGPDERTELERLRTRLVEVEVAFQRNLNEFRDGIDVTREQLAGLPDAYVERLSPGERDGTYRVSLDYPEVNPFLEQAHDRELRRQLFTKNWSKAVATNRPLLDEALDLRRRVAALLGNPTWAHHAMEVKMARSPERVAAFYEELVPPLAGQVRRELDVLAERLHADGHEGPIAAWDHRYYDDQLRRTEFGVDQNRISEYFPLERVLKGMFEISGEVLGFEVRDVPESGAWHESVRLYEIRDTASEAVLAHFYTDLHPREGKFGHAAAFPLVVGHRSGDGSWVTPVSAILANFTPPSGETPALLKHSEVKTLFHEFGHILHMSLTRAEFARFSGAETEWDFVEAPSQIMEHWIWDASVLQRFARHYRTDEPIPAELVDQMLRARWVDEGIRIGVQAFYGGIDLALHAEADAPDVDAALHRTYAVTGMPYPEGTFMLAGFGHLLGGYDAGYYGYLWAEVIGDDMFGRFAREGVLSPAVGADYRREILEPNGSRDADALVRAFLGREPSNAEFLRLRGMSSAADDPPHGS
ncbi:MAG TPA: M3 family metallopeptidase [Candidatus Limnocylindrales bacterium]|nr:M3 family metallopeptidase [Candidatus Limnocylindrales bacterium]